MRPEAVHEDDDGAANFGEVEPPRRVGRRHAHRGKAIRQHVGEERLITR